MKIVVKVKPGAREAYVKELDASSYEVAVKEPPLQGRANAAVIEALSEHLGVSRSRIRIVQGATSRHKIIEIS